MQPNSGWNPKMQIIVVRKNSASRTIDFSWPIAAAMILSALLLIALAVSAVFALLKFQPETSQSELITEWRTTLDEQSREMVTLRQTSDAKIEALAVKTAQLQSRLLRLDAVAERMVSMANMDSSEFDFSQAPAMGGPEGSIEEVSEVSDFHKSLDLLTDQIDRREQQLEYMESMLSNRELEDAGMLAGRPIIKGWMSSAFGYRTDPFKGHKAWHKGVDFAGKMGSEIIAVAAGVVTWSDKRYGYGNLVQINHGNGFSTRYGHNSELLVKSGQVVKKGQVIAKMGSSGRSTGAHVHFEVLKGGKSIDPMAYINRS